MMRAVARTARELTAALLVLAGIASLVACGEAPSPSKVEVAFDEKRAFRDLRALVELGPRPAGSPALAAARDYIESELRRAGVVVERMSSPVHLADGRDIEAFDVVGTLRGSSPRTVLLLTHYDTKLHPPHRLVEANGAASGPAVLLEIARNAARSPHRATLVFAFVDASQPLGEEATELDGLAGSRALVLEWGRTGRIDQLSDLVLVQSAADPDLQFANEASLGAHERLVFARILTELGLTSFYDVFSTVRVHSDQDPFLLRGFTHIFAILDPANGGTTPPGTRHQSEQDDLGNVSDATLGRVGAVTERLVETLDLTSGES